MESPRVHYSRKCITTHHRRFNTKQIILLCLKYRLLLTHRDNTVRSNKTGSPFFFFLGEFHNRSQCPLSDKMEVNRCISKENKLSTSRTMARDSKAQFWNLHLKQPTVALTLKKLEYLHSFECWERLLK